MSWRVERDVDRLVGHDYPAFAGSGMDTFTRDELELGARAALQLSDPEQGIYNLLDLELRLAGPHEGED